MSDSEIEVKISAESSGVQAPIDEAKDGIKSLAETADEVRDSFTGLAEIIGTTFAVDKLVEFTDHMAELGEQVEHTAAITGLTIDQVQEFQNVVLGTGGSIDTANVALTQLSRKISEAATGQLPEAVDAFKRLGVSQQELARGNLNEIMGTMADKLHDTADGANKVQAMIAAISRSGPQLIPIFDLGSAGIERLNKAFADAGANLGEGFADKLEALAQEMYLSKAATQGVSNALMSILLPSISAAVVGFEDMKKQFSNSISQGGILAGIISGVGAALDTLVFSISAVSTAFKIVWDTGVGALQGITGLVVNLGKSIEDLKQGNLSGLAEDLKKALASPIAGVESGLKNAEEEVQKLIDLYHKMNAVASDQQKVGLGAGRGNPNNPFGAPQVKSDTKNDEATKRQGYADTYAVRKEYDDLSVQSGKESRSQEFADLQKALSDEKTATDASFQSEMALYQEGSDQYEKVKQEMANADLKFQVESMKLTQEETKEAQKDWTEAINTIDKDFDSMLTGILQGTQTIGQAFERMAGNMIISFMEAIAKMLVQWAAFEVSTSINGNKAGLSNPFGGSGGGSKSGGTVDLLLAALGLNTTASTTNTVSTTANTSAVVSDTAATESASVSGGGGGGFFGSLSDIVPFLDNGAVSVSEGLHYLHSGEMVVPKPFAEGVRNGEVGGFGGGGGDTHLHVHAMDARSVKQFFNQHGSTIAKTLSGQVRGGNRSFLQHA